jgi:hypothetical protein
VTTASLSMTRKLFQGLRVILYPLRHPLVFCYPYVP